MRSSVLAGATAVGNPAPRERGGAAEILAQHGGAVAVHGTQKLRHVAGGLHAQFVAIKPVEGAVLRAHDWLMGCARRAQRPVEPKPPSPRAVEGSSSTSRMSARATGAMTSCAIRMPWVTAKGSRPMLISAILSSPR